MIASRFGQLVPMIPLVLLFSDLFALDLTLDGSGCCTALPQVVCELYLILRLQVRSLHIDAEATLRNVRCMRVSLSLKRPDLIAPLRAKIVVMIFNMHLFLVLVYRVQGLHGLLLHLIALLAQQVVHVL